MILGSRAPIGIGTRTERGLALLALLALPLLGLRGLGGEGVAGAEVRVEPLGLARGGLGEALRLGGSLGLDLGGALGGATLGGGRLGGPHFGEGGEIPPDELHQDRHVVAVTLPADLVHEEFDLRGQRDEPHARLAEGVDLAGSRFDEGVGHGPPEVALLHVEAGLLRVLVVGLVAEDHASERLKLGDEVAQDGLGRGRGLGDGCEGGQDAGGGVLGGHGDLLVSLLGLGKGLKWFLSPLQPPQSATPLRS